jgi:hypothetical protein
MSIPTCLDKYPNVMLAEELYKVSVTGMVRVKVRVSTIWYVVVLVKSSDQKLLLRFVLAAQLQRLSRQSFP